MSQEQLCTSLHVICCVYFNLMCIVSRCDCVLILFKDLPHSVSDILGLTTATESSAALETSEYGILESPQTSPRSTHRQDQVVSNGHSHLKETTHNGCKVAFISQCTALYDVQYRFYTPVFQKDEQYWVSCRYLLPNDATL